MSFNVGVTLKQKGEIMINKVAERIVNPAEQQVVRASTYIEEKLVPKVSVESMYSSPFALVGATTPTKEVVRPAGVGEILHFFG